MAYIRAKIKKETRELIKTFVGKKEVRLKNKSPEETAFTYPTFPKLEFKKRR